MGLHILFRGVQFSYTHIVCGGTGLVWGHQGGQEGLLKLERCGHSKEQT